MESKKMVPVLSVLVVILVLGLLLLAFSGPTGLFLFQSCEEVEEPYTTLEPYEEVQCYTVPVTGEECESVELSYLKSDPRCYWDGNTLVSEITVTNIDNAGGDFSVDIGVINEAGNKIGDNQTVFIASKSSQMFQLSYETDVGGCYAEVSNVPTKEVCTDVISTTQDCYNVTKFQEVTNYRTVKKCE